MKIETGIPIPPNHRTKKSRWFELAKEMEKFDSVRVNSVHEAKALGYVIRYYGHRAIQRKNKGGFYRVWKL